MAFARGSSSKDVVSSTVGRKAVIAAWGVGMMMAYGEAMDDDGTELPKECFLSDWPHREEDKNIRHFNPMINGNRAAAWNDNGTSFATIAHHIVKEFKSRTGKLP